jgi:hypothetical protein
LEQLQNNSPKPIWLLKTPIPDSWSFQYRIYRLHYCIDKGKYRIYRLHYRIDKDNYRIYMPHYRIDEGKYGIWVILKYL